MGIQWVSNNTIVYKLLFHVNNLFLFRLITHKTGSSFALRPAVPRIPVKQPTMNSHGGSEILDKALVGT